MEVSDDAMVLISISHQARERYKHYGKYMKVIGNVLPCDNLVTAVFLGFYIEASLTSIIEQMGENACLKKFNRNRKEYDTGLIVKLAYFYNAHIVSKDEQKASFDEFKKAFPYNGNPSLLQKLDNEFPGINDIDYFRNKISHGKPSEAIKRIINDYRDINDVDKLRDYAKAIVDTFLKFAHMEGYKEITKSVGYEDALKNYGWE